MSPQKIRMTPQRRVILKEIEKTDTHPAADEIYERVRRLLPRISLGTVYRNLEILSECGLIKKVDLGDGHRRFDGNLDTHYHVRCVECGRVGDLDHAPVAELEDAVRQKTDYEIVGHRLDFFGLCPRCKGTKPDEDGLGRPEETWGSGGIQTPDEEVRRNHGANQGIAEGGSSHGTTERHED